MGRAIISEMLGGFSASAVVGMQEGYKCGVSKLKLQGRIGMSNIFKKISWEVRMVTWYGFSSLLSRRAC